MHGLKVEIIISISVYNPGLVGLKGYYDGYN